MSILHTVHARSEVNSMTSSADYWRPIGDAEDARARAAAQAAFNEFYARQTSDRTVAEYALRALVRVCNTEVGTAVDELRHNPVLSALDVRAIDLLERYERELDAETMRDERPDRPEEMAR